jgi:hypothetical protein
MAVAAYTQSAAVRTFVAAAAEHTFAAVAAQTPVVAGVAERRHAVVVASHTSVASAAAEGTFAAVAVVVYKSAAVAGIDIVLPSRHVEPVPVPAKVPRRQHETNRT